MDTKPCSHCAHHRLQKSKFLFWDNDYFVCRGPQCVDVVSGRIEERRCDQERLGYTPFADSCEKADQDRHAYIIHTACGSDGKYWDDGL